MKQKILILGSDLGTIDLAKTAKEMGYYVITADLMETSPTKELSDESWMVSTQDIDALEVAVKENDIQAILAGASEINNDSVRKLSKFLGIDYFGENENAYWVARDKRKFKDICISVGLPIAEDYFLSDNLSREELDKVKYPVVVKPVDQSGNRGVSFCGNEASLIDAYKLARCSSNNPKIICERCLHGEEWAVQYVIAEGEAKLIMFGRENHQPNENANLYTFLNTTNYRLNQYLEETNELVMEAFRRSGFKDGIAWVEVMRDENDGKFYIIECAHRMGSESLYYMHREMSGFDSLKWMIEASLGNNHKIEDLPNYNLLKYQETAGAYHLFSRMKGRVNKITGLDHIEKMSDVVVDIPKRGPYDVGLHTLMGEIRIKGQIDEVIEKIKFINQTLKIEDDHGENMYIQFTDFDTLKKEFLIGLNEFQIN